VNTSLQDDIRRLRRELDDLADGVDDLVRYELRQPPMPPGGYWKLRWLVGLLLRWLEAARLKQPDPWPVRLRQAAGHARAKPLLIWAVGSDRNTLRKACRGFSTLDDSLPGFAPVLVTDVADFAFFSRLGWLVEYVPRLPGEGKPYDTRKASFLVRLYRGAPVLPVHAGLEVQSRREEILRCVALGD
jgi:hypothetical protein